MTDSRDIDLRNWRKANGVVLVGPDDPRWSTAA